MLFVRIATVAMGALLLLPLAQAADIVIDDPAWLRMKPEERVAVEKELRAIGALDPDDRIITKPIKDNTVSEQDFKKVVEHGILAGGRKAVCAAKNLFNRDKCGKETDAAAFKSCQAKEKARYDAVAAKC